MESHRARPDRRAIRRLTGALTLGAALPLTGCGEGPTENDGRRLCVVPLRVISPNPAPVLRTPIHPVTGANCRVDSPIIRVPAGDSTIIVVPVPRPTPVPNPGGG